MKKIILCSVMGLMMALSGCGSMSVKPVALTAINQGQVICIEDNPKVIVPAFDEYLKEAFNRHNIKVKFYDKDKVSETCEYRLHYVALRSWDMGTYLSKVKLELFDKNESQVALVDWRQNDFALNKWRNDQGKVYDLVDKLIGQKKDKELEPR